MNIDIAQEPLDKAKALVAKLIQKKVAKGKITQEECDSILGNLSYSTDYGELAGAKYVIEAVPERLDFKQSTFEKVDSVADADAVLLTNTSGINIDEIALATKRPGSLMGMHFFYPAPVMKLVELVRGAKTLMRHMRRLKSLPRRLARRRWTLQIPPASLSTESSTRMKTWVPGSSLKELLLRTSTAMKLACNHLMGPCELMDFLGHRRGVRLAHEPLRRI